MIWRQIAGRLRLSMTEQYVELHAASAFSFLEGASQPEQLVERAVALEMPAMALLDHNGVYGAARFHTSAQRNKVRARIGAEISVSRFAANPVWATKISASSSRSSKCGKRRKGMARRPSMISSNMLRDSFA